jgi:hypothetical protein
MPIAPSPATWSTRSKAASLRDELLLTEAHLAIPDAIAVSSDHRWDGHRATTSHTVVVYDCSLPPDSGVAPAPRYAA